MNPAELIAKVRKVEIKTKGLSQRLFSGEYHSAFKGRGMSFAEVRPYQYGDDVRFIDWNVTARYNVPYIKTFEEERELSVILLVDMSRSDDFGTQEMTKAELMTEVAAVISFSAISNNDKVGVIFFTDRIEKFIPPRKGRSHILRVIRELLYFKPEGSGTDISAAMDFLTQAVKKRCIAFMLSDFLDKGYEDKLRIASRKHDLIGIRTFDRMETELPDAGLLQVQDAETGQLRWIDTSNAVVRRGYHAIQEQKVQYFRNSFSRSGSDYMEISTAQPYLPVLHRFFQKRL
jgi:uncharacterized protein (DUF58 family)